MRARSTVGPLIGAPTAVAPFVVVTGAMMCAMSPVVFAASQDGAVPERFTGLTFAVFAAIIALTMYVT